MQIPTVAPQPQRETLLKPKTRKSIEDSSFKPRRTEALHPRRGRRSGFISRIRETSSDILERTSNIGRPRPFSTSDTSGALREQAAEAAAQTTPEVHRSLSQERGGFFRQKRRNVFGSGANNCLRLQPNFKPLKKTRWNPFHLEIYEPAATTMASRFLDWMRNDSVAKHPPIGFQTLVKHVALQLA